MLNNIPEYCDGCGRKPSVNHAMNCMKGGLVSRRHDEIQDEIGFLDTQALHPAAVRDEPIIRISRAPAEEEVRSQHDERGDLLVRGLFEKGQDAILDVRIVNPDSPSYRKLDHTQVVIEAENEKKKSMRRNVLIKEEHSPHS